MRRIGFPHALAALAGWLVAVAAVCLDVSDRDGAAFRIDGIGQASLIRALDPPCGNAPRRHEAWEAIEIGYRRAMGWADGAIAGARGEPVVDFDWLKRRVVELDRVRREGREVAEGMGRRAR